MKKIIFIILTIVCAVLLQTSILPAIPFLSAVPNVLLGITVGFALIYGQTYGMFIGLICGFLMDIYSGTLPGSQTLFYVLAGYLNGAFHIGYDYEEFRLPAATILITDFVFGCAVYVFGFLFGGSYLFPRALVEIILPETVATGLVMLLIYPILIWISHRIAVKKKGRARKFVSDDQRHLS